MKTIIAAGGDRKIKELEDNSVRTTQGWVGRKTHTTAGLTLQHVIVYYGSHAVHVSVPAALKGAAVCSWVVVCCGKPRAHCCVVCIALQGSGTQVTRELETQVLITALALPYGGRILFAATEMGVVRCYKYPLTGGPGRVTPGDRRCSGSKRACRQQLRQQTPSHLLTRHTGFPTELLLLLLPPC